MEENGTYHISPSCSMPGTSVTCGRLDFISEIMEYDENVVKTGGCRLLQRIRLELETTLAETERLTVAGSATSRDGGTT